MKLQSVAHIIRSSFRKGAPARLLEALADGCVKLKPSLARRYAPPREHPWRRNAATVVRRAQVSHVGSNTLPNHPG